MLEKISTRAPESFDKKETKQQTENILEEIASLQNLLYADGNHSLLIIFQGLDASGKDGVIKDVFQAINPMGLDIHSFKTPTEEELKHDFLWRIHKCVPLKGMITLFNRSHYEDVLITRVHGWINDELAEKRIKAINDFEGLLSQHNNTHIIKCYLHISEEEQQERLKERMTIPEKMWKYNKKDFAEAKKWNDYMKYYEEVFAKCNAIPWHIIPSDQNWYKSYLVAKLVRDTLQNLEIQYPPLKN